MKKQYAKFGTLVIPVVCAALFFSLCVVTEPLTDEEVTVGEVVSVTILDKDGNAFTEDQTEVFAGESIQLTVDVQVTNNASKIIQWELSGQSGATGLQYGLLQISNSETAGTILTVIARSVEDPSVYGLLKVKIKAQTPLPVYYQITTGGPYEGGSITVTGGITESVPNESITLSITVNSGYDLTSVTVSKQKGGTQTVSGTGSSRSFIMPDDDVTVTAVFTKKAVFQYIQANYASNEFDVSVCSFADKFEGTSLNLDKWGYQNGNGSQYGNSGWGNNESQAYKTENAVVENGTLKLIAKRESFQSRSYTSAKIVTANSQGNTSIGEPAAGAGKKFGQTYGRFEAKIRMSDSFKGAWPAFWMMPVSETYGGWPRSGEIDIMEMVGIKPNNSSSTLHMKPNWGTWESQYQGVTNTFQNSSTFKDWHVFGVHWNQDRIVFLLDGYETRTLQRTWWNSSWYAANSFTGASAPFDKDFHFILNLALDSGSFDKDNAVDSTTVLPAYMEIEWVRSYTLANDPWPLSFDTHPAGLKVNHGN